MKKGEKRGLSPVIATILLVGLVVASGVIIFAWFQGFTKESVTKFDQNVQFTCNDVQFEAKYSDSEDILDISNIGTIPIYGMKIKTVDSSGNAETTELSESDGWPKNGLNTNGAASISGSFSGQVTLIPVLVGTSQKGEKTQVACDETSNGVHKLSL